MSRRELTGHEKLILGRLVERLGDEVVLDFDPRVLQVSAAALAAMHEAAWQRTPEIRGHQTTRYRAMELMAEKALPFEELAEIALSGPDGMAVVLAGLRVLLCEIGHGVHPLEAEPAGEQRALAGIVEGIGRIACVAGKALSDGNVDEGEARDVDREIPAIKERIATWEASRGLSPEEAGK